LKVLELSTTGTAQVSAVAGDPWGNVILAGSFDGTLDFGGGARTATSGTASGFLARFDASGSYLSDRIYDHALFAQVLVDPAGDLIVAGFLDGFDLTGQPLPAAADFVAKLDPAGDVQWSKVVVITAPGPEGGSPLADLATGGGLAIGRCGNVLVSGYTSAPANAPDVQGTGLYVNAYDPTGAILWSRSRLDGGLGGTEPWAPLAVDAQGDVFLVQGPQYLVMKLDPDGNVLWSGPSHAVPLQVGAGDAGELYALMGYGGSFDVGTPILPDPGHPALGVVRYDTLGNVASAMALPLSAEVPSAMSVDPSGTVLVAGSAVDPATLGPLAASAREVDREGHDVWSWSPPSGGVSLSFATGFDRRGLPLVAGLLNGKSVAGQAVGIPVVEDGGAVVATIVGGSLFIAFVESAP
jgi:hypothetical protein